MRNFALILVLLLVACSKGPPPTIEEKVLMNFFIKFKIAESFDKTCNKPRILVFDPNIQSNLYWLGNMQVISARFGDMLHKRDPKASVEKLVKRMTAIGDGAGAKFEKVLNDKGCDSDEGKDAAKLFAAFTNLPPWSTFAIIDKQITDAGGTITPPSEDKVIRDKPKT